MTLDQIKKVLKELEEFDLSFHSEGHYNNYLTKFSSILDGWGQVIVAPYYTNSFNIYRARKSTNSKAFHSLSEVWYPPEYNVKPGRLNFPFNPIFFQPRIIKQRQLRNIQVLMTILQYNRKIRITKEIMNCVQIGTDLFDQEILKRMKPSAKEIYAFPFKTN